MTHYALAVLLLSLQSVSQVPGVEVQATFAPDSVRIGEVLTLTVSVEGVAENAEVSFPEFPDTGVVTALGPPQLLSDTGAGVRVARYQLAAWDVGELVLPPGEIRVVTDVAELLVPLPEVYVSVVSVLPVDADTDTLAWEPPADVVGSNWSLAEQLAGAGLALALLLATLVYARRLGNTAPVPVPAGTPPRDRALAALERLSESGLAEAGEIKGFYSALSQIVREFLADSQGRWGLDLTTPEIVAAVSSGGVDPSEMTTLGDLLIGTDLVKFARSRPSSEEAASSLTSAKNWITDFELPSVELELEAAEPMEGDQDDWMEGAVTVLEELFADADEVDEREPLGS